MSALWQLTHYFLIQAILHFFHHTVFLKADDGTRSSLLGAAKHIYELLRLELVGQLAEAFTIAGAAFPDNELLVLVGVVVEGHFAKEELLALVLNLHPSHPSSASSFLATHPNDASG